MAYVSICVSLALSLTFGVSATTKMRGFVEFVTSAELLNLLSRAYRRPIARAVVALESVLAACHLGVAGAAATGVGRNISVPIYSVSLLVLLSFTAAVSVGLHRGWKAPCRCFGKNDLPLGWMHIVRNVILVALTSVGLVATALDATSASGVDTLLSGIIGLAFGLVMTRFDDLYELIR